NREQPRAKRRTVLVRRERVERPQERLLGRILGVGSLAEHARGEPQASRRVPVNERREGASIAVERATYQLRVRHSAVLYLRGWRARHTFGRGPQRDGVTPRQAHQP